MTRFILFIGRVWLALTGPKPCPECGTLAECADCLNRGLYR